LNNKLLYTNIFFIFILIHILFLGETLIKINFTHTGKKEHYYMLIPDQGIRIYKKRPKEELILNPPINDSNSKMISIFDITKFTYGISSDNLRKRFKNMKNSNLRCPHLFFSVLTKKRSIDLYMDEDSLVKWFFGISHYLKENKQSYKIISTSKFLITKLKLRMLLNLKEYYQENITELKGNKYGKLINDILLGK